MEVIKDNKLEVENVFYYKLKNAKMELLKQSPFFGFIIIETQVGVAKSKTPKTNLDEIKFDNVDDFLNDIFYNVEKKPITKDITKTYEKPIGYHYYDKRNKEKYLFSEQIFSKESHIYEKNINKIHFSFSYDNIVYVLMEKYNFEYIEAKKLLKKYVKTFFDKDARIFGSPETAYTNGLSINFNEYFINDIFIEEFNGVLLHELLHIILKSSSRRGTKNHRIWNYATDFVINQMIVNNFKNIQEVVIPENCLYDTQFDGMSAEDIYEILLQNRKTMSNEEFEKWLDEVMKGNILIDDCDGDTILTDEQMEKLRGIIAKSSMYSKMQGSYPSFMDRFVNNILLPKVDWRGPLKIFLQSFESDWDFMYRNRNYLHTNMVIPTFKGDKVKIIISLDTSGSITEDDMSQYLSEAYSIISIFNNVEIIAMCCDAEIYKDYITVINSKQDLLDFAKDKIKGGGGTDFRPVIEYVEENFTYNEKSNIGMIYFTDGYGTFPEEEPSFKTIWAITTDVISPVGKTIEL